MTQRGVVDPVIIRREAAETVGEYIRAKCSDESFGRGRNGCAVIPVADGPAVLAYDGE